MKEICNSVYCHPGAICKVCYWSVAKKTGSDSQYHFGGIPLVRWLSVARAAPFRRIGHTQARHGNRHTSSKGRCKTLSRSVRGFANTANTIAYHGHVERGASRDGLINRTDSSGAQGPSSSFLATTSFGQTFGQEKRAGNNETPSYVLIGPIHPGRLGSKLSPLLLLAMVPAASLLKLPQLLIVCELTWLWRERSTTHHPGATRDYASGANGIEAYRLYE